MEAEGENLRPSPPETLVNWMLTSTMGPAIVSKFCHLTTVKNEIDESRWVAEVSVKVVSTRLREALVQKIESLTPYIDDPFGSALSTHFFVFLF